MSKYLPPISDYGARSLQQFLVENGGLSEKRYGLEHLISVCELVERLWEFFSG